MNRLPSSGLRPPRPTSSGFPGRNSGNASNTAIGSGLAVPPAPASPSSVPSPPASSDTAAFFELGFSTTEFAASKDKDRSLNDRTFSASSRPSRTPSAHPSITQRPSDRDNRISPFPSDIGLGFERVISEHFANVASFGAAGPPSGSSFVHRTDSAASGAPFQGLPQSGNSANGNPITSFRFTFQSLRSYGNTEKSSSSLCDDRNPFAGGVYRHGMSSVGEDSFMNSFGSLHPSFQALWGSPEHPLVSKVAETAGALYRKECFDELWLLGNPIGAGACSEVRLGQSKDGTRTVAIKIVLKGAPDLFTPDGECREVLSFKIAGKHPNVVACYEVYEDERFIYLVLELLTGGPMLRRVANEQIYARYCENDIATIVRDLVKGLAHLHELGIAHRDVKPENVLFASDTMDPLVKLTDFGIAQSYCLTNSARDMVGTPLYVAPEVLLRRPYGCQADMWSLGVLVHILLTGYPPFDHDDLVQLVNMVKYEPFRMDGDEWLLVSDAARDFVGRLLTREVGRRLTAKQALAHPWLSSPRPPPFPAPQSRPLDSKNSYSVLSEGSTSPSQDGTTPLLVAQASLRSFVIRKEFKRYVHRKASEQDLKLSMLVSLSEKSLKISDSFNALDDKDVNEKLGSNSDARRGTDGNDNKSKQEVTGVETPASSKQENAADDDAKAPVIGRKQRREQEREKRRAKREAEKRITESSGVSSGSVSRERGRDQSKAKDLKKGTKEDKERMSSHDREQEKLRQQRLQLQAELSRRRKTETSTKSSSVDGRTAGEGVSRTSGIGRRSRRTNGTSERTASGTIGSFSPASSCESNLSQLGVAAHETELNGASKDADPDDLQRKNALDLWKVSAEEDDDDMEWGELLIVQRERREADAQEDLEQVSRQWRTGRKGENRLSGTSTKDRQSGTGASAHEDNASNRSRDRSRSKSRSKSRRSERRKSKDKKRKSILRRNRDDDREDDSSS